MNSTIVIKPIGDSEINLKNIENLAKVFDQTPNNGEIFINSVLALSRNPEAFQKTLATIDIKVAATLSEILHKISKSVIKDPQLGLPIKTAAAMGAFELSYGILKDLAGYCKEVAVALPFSNKEVRTSGLRAAGFWLNRSLAIVKNYSFADFEALFDELSMIQSGGYTYAQVFSDPNLRRKVKSSFEFIDRNVDMSHSPMISALKGINKTMATVGHIGPSDQEAAALLAKLQELLNLENEFFAEYDRLGDAFKPDNNEKVNVVPVQEMLLKLKAGQKELETDMVKTIRLLTISASEDKDALFTQFASLLSHQINVMETENPSIPYFENVRKAFIQSQNFQPIIETSRACVLGETVK